MPGNEELRQLVARMPDPDDHRGTLTENIDKERIEKAIADIYAGGPEQVRGLVEMLGEPGSDGNVKPHYALHCLVNHVLVIRDEAGRRQVCEVLADELSAERPVTVKAYLCQELGWAGRDESLAALGRLLVDKDLASPAAMALMAIRKGAAAAFREAWPQAKGETRRQIIDGLAALAEPPSSIIFREALHDDDQEVRIAAAAGLAELGEKDAADPLLAAAAAAEGWERFQTGKSCLVLAEKLAASGDKASARRVYEQLKEKVGSAMPHVGEAADRGLAALKT